MSGGRLVREPEEQEKFHRLVRIGLIKVGYKDERGTPHSADYFIPQGEHASEFTQAFGEKPSKIMIVFPSNDREEVCNESLECWGTKATGDAGKRLAYGDRETFMLWNHDKGQYIQTARANMPAKLGKWSHCLTLRVLLPDMPMIGYWQLTTSASESSIPAIAGMFDWMMHHAGTVAGIPWDMQVKFHTSKKPGSTSRYPVIMIIPHLGQKHIEKLREFQQILATNPGLVTAERIELLIEQQKQLPAPRENPE